MKHLKTWGLLITTLWLSGQALALQMNLPSKGNTIAGSIDTVMMQPNQDLYWLARHHDVALDDLKSANQGIQPDMTAIDHLAIEPKQYILPDVPYRGIVVNIATKRLYYFPKNKAYFYTFPVGIGRPGWITPVGQYKIDEKIKYPIWIVPDSIMKYRQEHGDPIGKIVKAGPLNPLGDFAMRLSDHHYLIHSTNEPDGVGQRSSAGCIRMYPEDIALLFPIVPINTPVKIIYQPYNIGVLNKKLFVQVYPPFLESHNEDTQGDGSFILTALATYITKHHLKVVQLDEALAKQATLEATDIPVAVAQLQ
jgi:L,D-transpeptidase ErfK/SrfK